MNRSPAGAVPPRMTDPPPPPAWNPDPRDRIVEVASCANEVEAAILSAALSGEEIPHRVVGGALSVMSSDIRFGAVVEPKIWTLERDAPAAANVVAALRANHGADRDRIRDRSRDRSCEEE